MTPKEKSKELYWKFYRFTDSEFNELHHKYTRDCSLIAVDEILESHYKVFTGVNSTIYEYYQEVKQEIEKL